MGRYSNIVLSLGVCAPFSIYAVGLGKIDVSSNLNQPLLAKIKLISARGIPLSQIKAGLADENAYRRADLERPYFLSKITFNIENINGQPYIVLKTKERIESPFLQILVDLAWSKGQFYRAYTVLLDPPGYETESIVVNKEPIINKEPDYAVPYSPPRASDIKPQFKAVYGPTVASDELWVIAKKYQPEGLNIQQVMMAIYLANPSAFINENVNKLRVGQKLKIPTDARMRQVNPEKANLESIRHENAWKDHQKDIQHVLTPSDMEQQTEEPAPPKAKSSNQMLDTKAGSIPSVQLIENTEIIPALPVEEASVSSQIEKSESLADEQITLVSQNTPTKASEQEFVALHPMIESLLKKANELNKGLKDEKIKLEQPSSKDKSLENQAIETAKVGNELLKNQISSLEAQNELLKQALMAEKNALNKTNLEIKNLNAKLIKYFERNERGELILKGELSAKDDSSVPYTTIFLILALLAVVSNLVIYALYRAQKQSIREESQEAVDKDSNKVTDKKQKTSNPTTIKEEESIPKPSPTNKEHKVPKQEVKSQAPIAPNHREQSSDAIINMQSKDSTKGQVNQNDLSPDTKDKLEITEVVETLEFDKPLPNQPITEHELHDEMETAEGDNTLEFEQISVKTSVNELAKEPTEGAESIKDDSESILEFEVHEFKKPEEKTKEAEAISEPVDDNSIEFNLEKPVEPPNKKEEKPIDCKTQLALAETYLSMKDYEMVKITLDEVLAKGTEQERKKAESILSRMEQ